LQYAFIEFEDKKACEDAYFKMDNVLIDDRRIHVDFSQSVSKYKWKGKGRGVEVFDDTKKSYPKSAPAPWIQQGRPGSSAKSNYEKQSSSREYKDAGHSDAARGGGRYFKQDMSKHQWSRSPPRYSRGHATEQKRKHDEPP
jgi:peptidyl-prolyl cis-trans isomerase-like 4